LLLNKAPLERITFEKRGSFLNRERIDMKFNNQLRCYFAFLIILSRESLMQSRQVAWIYCPFFLCAPASLR